MGRRPAKVNYRPKHPEKYKGSYPIVSRSSWETSFMDFCDLNQNVLEWASEPLKIPYSDPITGTQKVYIPDFLLLVNDSRGFQRTLLIEIKPEHEALKEKARSAADEALIARNQAKWAAAAYWCQRRGIQFQVITEADMFARPEDNKLDASKLGKTPKTKAVSKYKDGLRRPLAKRAEQRGAIRNTTPTTQKPKNTKALRPSRPARPKRPTRPSRRVGRR